MVIAGEGIAGVEITVRECRVGIEFEGAAESAAGFFVAAREQVEDRQCGLGLSNAIVERSRPPSRLTRAGKRLRRLVAPTEHGDEMVGESKIGVGDCVRRVERDRFSSRRRASTMSSRVKRRKSR